MARKFLDPDNPPTQESDWVGAEVLAPGERHARRIGPVTFHVFRSSLEPDLFAVTDQGESSCLPPCPRGAWLPFKVLPETGKRRVGFSEEDAKRGIANDGHYLFRLQLAAAEHVAP
jgi:hypothetical protein